MREGADDLYFKYKLIESNQDWKCKWFYTYNQCPQLPKPSMYPPVYDECWKEEPSTEECLDFGELQRRITELKRQGLTAERVAYSFMKRRVLPLMKREHYGFEYTGADDSARMAVEEISDDLIMIRLKRIFKVITAVPAAVEEYSAQRPPNSVRSTRVLIPLHL